MQSQRHKQALAQEKNPLQQQIQVQIASGLKLIHEVGSLKPYLNGNVIKSDLILEKQSAGPLNTTTVIQQECNAP